MPNTLTFEDFKNGWLEEIVEGEPSTSELGRRFARKLFTQWQDIPENVWENLVICDGSGDGGIDIAYLTRKDDVPNFADLTVTGDTWYLVQSKYGKAFQGSTTLFTETQKVLDTLEGKRNNLSSLAEGLLTQLTTFLDQSSNQDRLVLVFATVDPLDDGQKKTLQDLRVIGRSRFGAIFDVEAVSVGTIYEQSVDEAETPPLKVSIQLNNSTAIDELWVGPVSLMAIYEFMKEYRTKTEDLNRLYDKNVRRFLGARGKINREIQNTLKETPEHFGLYNNGITIVVNDFHKGASMTELIEPYVVNGCQTTRSIWEVFHQNLEAGGTGISDTLEEWKQRAEKGVVVTKIVRVLRSDDTLLRNTIKFTNSQNAVRDKDFLALNNEFKKWEVEMGNCYGVFLETQRGGWDAQNAIQKQKTHIKPFFKEHTNAFDLIKVYAAGWLGEAGTAWNKNSAFTPGGTLFKQIVDEVTGDTPFGVDDLYAAYRLHLVADTYRFGRGAEKDARKLTRYLYYMVVGELLKDIMVKGGYQATERSMTAAMLKLFKAGNEATAKKLFDAAIRVVDSYMTVGTDHSIFKEDAFQNAFGSNMNAYLKWEDLGKENKSLQLRSLLSQYKAVLGLSTDDNPPPSDQITSVIGGL